MYQNDFVLGATASCIAATFTNPWEVVKTRLQLQNELCRASVSTPRIYQNAVQAFQLIFRREGIVGLQRGLISAYLYQSAMNGTRLGCYDPLRRYILAQIEVPWVAALLSGFGCGLLGAFIASPLYLIKSRMQAYSSDPELKKIGVQRHYNGILNGLRSIVEQQGVRGLWNGVSGSMLRTGVGSMVQLTSYDTFKRWFTKHESVPPKSPVLVHLQASLVTGFLVTLCMNPFDVVTTRLYNQKQVTRGTTPVYSGPFNALFKIFKSEGLPGLYKGVTAHWLRVGPHNVLTFVFLEQLRYFAFSSPSDSPSSSDTSLSDIA